MTRRPCGRAHGASAAVATVLIAAASLSIGGCGGGDPAAEHRDEARRYLAEGRSREAMIALQNALKLAPDDADLHYELGQALTLLDSLADARFYYGEAYALDPSRADAAVRQAVLLSASDPEQATALVDEVVAAHPDNPWGHLGLAQLALERSDTTTALAAAERAVEIDPEFVEGYLQLNHVHQARLREHLLSERIAPDATYQAALDALNRAEELDVSRQWLVANERARVYSVWPHHEEEARQAFRAAHDAANTKSRKRTTIERADKYARSVFDGVLLGWALRSKVELDPADGNAWNDLAQNTENRGGSFEAILREWKTENPDDPNAHISYARYLAHEQGFGAAAQYLEQQIADSSAAAPLLAALARLQLRAGQRDAANAAIDRLSTDYPDHRQTALLSARRFQRELRPGVAVRILSELPWTADDAEAQRILADSFEMLGLLDKEIAALDRIVALSPGPNAETRRIEARAAHARGRYAQALALFKALHENHTQLTETERLWFARSAYETGSLELGRGILRELVGRRVPSLAATVELAQRDHSSEEERAVARAGFDRILARDPLGRRAIHEATNLELAVGDTERAVERLGAAIEIAQSQGRGAADLLVRRAQILDRAGKMDDARSDAWAAFRSDPKYPDALPTLVGLYSDVAAEEAARRSKDRGTIGALEHAFIGRLQLISGNTRAALVSIARALASGADLPILRKDLAYLLAREGTDLPRALLLAQEAVQQLRGSAGAIDTLGYVRLKTRQAREAESKFQQAIALAQQAGTSTALYRYHLGLAMDELGKREAAIRSIERALVVDSSFREADEARAELERMRGEASG